MAEGCIGESWNHTAAVLALLANVHRDPKKGRAFGPADFHPMRRSVAQKPAVLKGSVELLKTVFVDNLCGKPGAN